MELLLEEIIEALRFEMIEKAFLHGSLTDEKVVAISQKLDDYIILYQRQKMRLLSRVSSNQHLSLVVSL
ncbi:aspartyl-phosphate phosphatase Spo0E family protein [Paenibacillus sp. yr247]|uniref:aspartyl-phosphate phosphatase Spo0E family protein n=1 Tax=Paenibacillus sp. yr247 TaxID=1761880 RepID=UPI000B869783|nr:aspartyl-phosphate phosphatase Spo0E family protein [Paenibacillus sp. yr247]